MEFAIGDFHRLYFESTDDNICRGHSIGMIHILILYLLVYVVLNGEANWNTFKAFLISILVRLLFHFNNVLLVFRSRVQ